MSEMTIKIEQEQKQRLNDIKNGKEKSLEKGEKNNFIMMCHNYMPEIRWLINKSGKASNILNFIMEHMDDQNVLMCSYKVFQDYFEISHATVARCIKLLSDNGFIDVLKSGTSNVYVVNKEIVWHHENEYCKFNGNILISINENKDYEYISQSDRLKALRKRENLKS